MDKAVVKPQRASTGGRSKYEAVFLKQDLTQAIARKEIEMRESDQREERHRNA